MNRLGLWILFILVNISACSSPSKKFPDVSLKSSGLESYQDRSVNLVEDVNPVPMYVNFAHVFKKKIIFVKSNSSFLRFCAPNILKKVQQDDSYHLVVSRSLTFLYARMNNAELLSRYSWDLFKTVKSVKTDKELERSLRAKLNNDSIFVSENFNSPKIIIENTQDNKKYLAKVSDTFASVEIVDNKVIIKRNGFKIEKILGIVPQEVELLPSFCDSIRL